MNFEQARLSQVEADHDVQRDRKVPRKVERTSLMHEAKARSCCRT